MGAGDYEPRGAESRVALRSPRRVAGPGGRAEGGASARVRVAGRDARGGPAAT